MTCAELFHRLETDPYIFQEELNREMERAEDRGDEIDLLQAVVGALRTIARPGDTYDEEVHDG
jgi:hypothetical protein